MKICDHFRQIEKSEATHSWTLVTHNENLAPVDSLAECLADKIMELRCIGCQHHYEAWRERFMGGPPLSSVSYAALSNGFIKAIVGVPNIPISADHLQGGISQYLWYFLVLESSTEAVIRVERPGFAAIDHGGDGLVTHRVGEGNLMFRLWEIKKCVGESHVSSTISTAYKQLTEQATEYLARYTSIGQETQDAELEEFYGKLPDLWIEASPAAAVGVSVALNTESVPTTSFTTFGSQFPKFLEPKRLRGMLTAIDDFPAFSVQVQKAIWKGL